MADHHTANTSIEGFLDQLANDLETMLGANILNFNGVIQDGVDVLFRDAIEAIVSKRSKLAIVLDTPGGYIEIAERIVNTTRHHFSEVDFYILDSAMSAGTVLVMSGDAIHMDYFSVLGPIDPQVQRPGGGKMIPALGYLAQYEKLIEKDRNGTLTTAEANILVQCFDQAELYGFERARDLTITLLKQWLTKYKFKDWKKTRSQNLDVTDDMKSERATEIASALNDPGKWHSHARGLSIHVLRTELNLQVEDFGTKPKLSEKLRSYHKLLKDYMLRRAHQDVLHMNGRYSSLWEV